MNSRNIDKEGFVLSAGRSISLIRVVNSSVHSLQMYIGPVGQVNFNMCIQPGSSALELSLFIICLLLMTYRVIISRNSVSHTNRCRDFREIMGRRRQSVTSKVHVPV